MSILSDEEKIAFEKIASLSLKDKTVIKDVLFSILSYASIEGMRSDSSEVIIPYLCKLKINYSESACEEGMKSNLQIEAEPLPSLYKEYVCIKNGENPPTKKYFEKQNRLHLKKILKIGEDEV